MALEDRDTQSQTVLRPVRLVGVGCIIGAVLCLLSGWFVGAEDSALTSAGLMLAVWACLLSGVLHILRSRS